MPRLFLESDRLHLEIDPALGAGVAGLSIRRGDGSLWPLLRPAPANAGYFNHLASYFLAPWPNRIAAGRFRWHGGDYSLLPDWHDGTAIHGCVKDRPWRIVERSPVSATLEVDIPNPIYPWPCRCTARYELSGSRLVTDLSVTSIDGLSRPDAPMPAGLGFHPFFMRKLWDPRDEVAVRCSLRGRYPADNMLPTGPARPDSITEHLAAGRPLGTLALDDVFLGGSDGATISWPASGMRAVFGCSPTLGHAVLYTGQPDAASGEMPAFFCLEPVTMVNNGFNLLAAGMSDTGVAPLEPGQTLHARWTLRIEPIAGASEG